MTTKSPEETISPHQLGVDICASRGFWGLQLSCLTVWKTQSRDWHVTTETHGKEITFHWGYCGLEDGESWCIMTFIGRTLMTSKVSILRLRQQIYFFFSDTHTHNFLVVNNLAVSIKLLSYLQKQQLNI